MRTTQVIAKLKEMAGKAGEAVYERLKLASQVLDDNAWIAEAHNGDEFAAQKAIEDGCFGDLCGAMTLGELLTVFRAYPSIEAWRPHFNLKAMMAKYEAAQTQAATEQDKPARTVIKKADYEAVTRKLEDADYQLKREREALRAKETEVERLRRENEELRIDKARLEGQVKELERILERESVAA